MEHELLTLPQPEQPPKHLPGFKASIDYPSNRRPFFMNKYVKRLFDEAFGQRIGSDAVQLLVQVVSMEDTTGYKRNVDFYNTQLRDRLGWSSEHRLINARKKCIEYGLLYYHPSVKRTAGLYRVLVPPQWEPFAGCQTPAENSLQIQQGNFRECDRESEGNREGIPQPSIPLPIPSSNPIPTIPGTGGGGDEDLIIRLRTLGLGKATATIREARRKGADRSYITSVMDYYERNRAAFTSVGVIHWRLTNDELLAFPPAEGWPNQAKGGLTQAKVDRMVQADRLKTQADAQSSAARKVREEQILLRFNDRLSAMTPDELQRMAEADRALRESLQRFGAGSRTVKLMICNRLAQVAEPPR